MCKPIKEISVTNPQFLKLRFHSTQDIIAAIQRRTNLQETWNLSAWQNNDQIDKPAGSKAGPEPQTRNTDLNNKHETQNSKQIFPNQAMLNFHPQRWNDTIVPWMKELVWPIVKNKGKRLLKTVRDER